jgi:putative two-component system response regulator
MHNNMILAMATMVESRDNSTGGHIKRTSKVVNILISEIQKDKSKDRLVLSAEFCHNIIKAAPMHDLGKIAVDDAILRKPGRFTDEEFEKMKIHAAEGARIVHEILEGTDDKRFHILAENVAHYHHERWDGSGYPEGLKGEEIPLEARIMAVADVYDALVSKRVYKDAMDFEKADSIMMESFGMHFDKQLEKYYVAARPKLEAYYSSAE